MPSLKMTMPSDVPDSDPVSEALQRLDTVLARLEASVTRRLEAEAAPDDRDAELRSILMAWRREVKRTSGAPESRAGVQAAKVALGERGDPWWEQSDEEHRARWEADVPTPDGPEQG